MEMEDIEQKLKQVIYTQLFVAERKRLYNYAIMDWGLVRCALEQYLVPSLINLVVQLIEEKEESISELQESNIKLSAKLNLHTGSNPERGHRIVEFHKQGLSRGQIAKEVGMSKWGVSKALKRLGVN